ncbi:MAG: hypothetical protein KDI11_04310, partial [Alphaproteobacteria bacterium]|nr:hypothetical protein [Alphaproteobacteria bacterium]
MAVNTPDVQKILLGKVREWLNTNRDALNALVPNDHPQKAELTINEIPELSALPNATETVSEASQKALAILEQFDNQALRESFANEIMPALQVIAISEAIKTDLEKNTISLETPSGTFQIQWNHMRNGAINPELEDGFSYRTHDGKKLESLGAENAQIAQNAIDTALAHPATQPLIQGEMARIIAERLKKTDREPNDEILPRHIRAVRQGFLNQIGRVNPNSLLDIATIPAFYDAMKLIEANVDPDIFKNIMKGKDDDIKMASGAFDNFIKAQMSPATQPAPTADKTPPTTEQKPVAPAQQTIKPKPVTE